MVQVTNFLLRWLFLCRLVDDRAEVQTWPYRRPGYYEHPPPPQPQDHAQPLQHPQHPQHQHEHDQNAPPHEPQHQQPPRPPPNAIHDDDVDMPAYRESVIRSLTSYPPGSSERLQRLEELRLETVREFARRLARADEVIRRGASGGGLDPNENEAVVDGRGEMSHRGGTGECDVTDMHDDLLFDVDEMIQDDFRRFMRREHAHETSRQEKHSHLWKRWHFLRGHHDEIEDGHATMSSEPGIEASRHNPLQGMSTDQIQTSVSSARQLLTEARDFLPQLVSTVLHSPPALLPESPSAPDPISSLRSLLVHRCVTTPSLGIELCWLLEAEVGRKWKALFEHRQQTGKRLILIVQADIAAAIATIGAERASAFNLLQDAEMATAFGTERTRPHEDQQRHPHGLDRDPHSPSAAMGEEDFSPRPPRSVSDLRCRHFGDSMHFVDRLTQISLDLRHVPPVHRQDHLRLRLAELNGRLCRRMVTRGRISIDVDDPSLQDGQHHQQQHQYGHASAPRWSEEDIREDMIPHSVHFPMEPQCVRWPGGAPSASSPSSPSSASQQPQPWGGGIPDFEHPPERNGVVRALRILPGECRVLDSAARCPFLVRMEVAESGLDADDARLYGGDSGGGVGLTIGEALGSVRGPFGNSILGHGHGDYGGQGDGFAPCEIPPELMGKRQQRHQGVRDAAFGNDASSHGQNKRITVEGLSRFETEVSGGDSTSDFSSYSPSGSPVTSYDSGSDATTSTTTEENHQAVLSRGGYQGEDEGYYGPPPDGTFDMTREQHYEEVHHDLRHQRENEFNSPDPSMASASSNQLSTGAALLNKVFGQPWSVQCEQIRSQSPYREVKGWKLASFIIKAGEDIRKEALVMQIMSKLWTWFREEIPPDRRPYLRPYTIMCVGGDAGIVECLPDVKSVNEVKRGVDGFTTLKNFFERAYGPPIQPPFRPEHHQQQYPGQQQQQPSMMPSTYGTVSFEKARDNFLRSLVGYSVICYILQIKDRHNANILIDREGHIMHIDFGFVLGETPKMGKVPLFSERAPFKLSAEFWEVIGGWSAFRRFCIMFEAAYTVASSHSDEICSLVEAAVMNVSRDAVAARRIAEGVRGRMRMRADPRDQKMHIMEIVNDAITSWGTSTYDWLQRSMHGYQ